MGGRLGHGGNTNEMVPRMVEGLVGVKVAHVAAGAIHTVICTAEGRVWTFGHGGHGRLGHGGNTDEMVPRIVEGLVGVKVAQVAAGHEHTVICTTCRGSCLDVWARGIRTVVSATVVTPTRWCLE